MNLRLYNKIVHYLNADESLEKEVIKTLSQKEKIICTKYLDELDNILSADQPDYDKIWKDIETRTTSKFTRFFIQSSRYAAALVVAVGISYLSYRMYNTFTTPSKITAQLERQQSIKQPSLILSNGNIVGLCKDKSSTIIDTKELEAYNNNNTLEYKIKNDTVLVHKYNTIVVPRGAEYSLRLSDGTQVHLNSESIFKYPVNLQNQQRKVFLEGEAYFKVKRNKHKPFVVKAGDVNIQVLGTVFNINAYKDNNNIATTLVEGKVKIINKHGDIILKPNQQAVYSLDGIYSREVDIKKYISWINGKFYFENIRLEKIMCQLCRWYNIEVFFINQESKNYLYTGVINKEFSLDKILKILQEVIPEIKIRRKDKAMYIEKNSTSCY